MFQDVCWSSLSHGGSGHDFKFPLASTMNVLRMPDNLHRWGNTTMGRCVSFVTSCQHFVTFLVLVCTLAIKAVTHGVMTMFCPSLSAPYRITSTHDLYACRVSRCQPISLSLLYLQAQKTIPKCLLVATFKVIIC